MRSYRCLISHRLLQKLNSVPMAKIAKTPPHVCSDGVLVSIAVLTSTLTFDPLQVSLGLTSVTIGWTSLADDVTSAITKMRITYRKSQNADDVLSRDLDPHDSHVSLVGLTSGTAYVTKFKVLLINGTTITTPPLHFVTVAEGSF